MTDSPPLPAELRRLFKGGAAGHRAPSSSLPAGRLVGAEEGDDPTPVLWMSDGPAPVGLWEALHRERQASGLWPLLLAPLRDEPEFRPWGSQELFPARMSSLDGHDAADLLREWWEGIAGRQDEDPEEEAERRAITAPFGPSWPGAAPAPAATGSPDEHARALAAALLHSRPALRIGLVAAGSGAAALTVCGWSGPLNHENDMGKIASVLSSWEERFGAQVVAVGFDTLELSVAAPPGNFDEALLVAAEHLALCPDNILQGVGALSVYAEHLVEADNWTLWWD
ncbi:DUF4253 domain-containing protein [Kitasatospora herbaricolor]|uniref:DUF4253 domain-containing protein n=1 Tax=Kitasatospora herbaricolor TaxID=68217 RepID=A0ABZ1W0B9_9ACTN|nr:DUF4253 domain-containing protein [Kitasatospora herbaricolor]